MRKGSKFYEDDFDDGYYDEPDEDDWYAEDDGDERESSSSRPVPQAVAPQQVRRPSVRF